MRRSTIVIAAVIVAGLAGITFRGDMPAPSPSPTSRPDECTPEYEAENGICITWHDMHYPGVEWHKEP